MLDLKTVVGDMQAARVGLGRRGQAAAEGLTRVSELAAKRKAVKLRKESLLAEKNEANATMRALDKNSEAFVQRRDALKAIGQEQKQLEQAERDVEAELGQIMLALPNIPCEQAPDGLDESQNVEVRAWGERPSYDFAPNDHVDVGSKLGIFDFERASKISGSRFSILMGAGARLERALMSFMLDMHTEQHGYTEVWPPALVLDSALRGTGQLPKFADDLFKIESAPESSESDSKERKKGEQAKSRDLYLIPTAEVPLTNMYADEILEADQLPLCVTAYTPCFRSEAGSHGRDTRGLIRQHQFDKVELVRFETPERAEAAHQELTKHAEAVLQALGLHYRVVELCAGDMGFSAQRCYDLEVWLPGQGAYREISSCSWFGDFQARRAKIRYRPGPGEKPRLLHTVNGSGLAVGRTVVAILEQHQRADGSVAVPPALVPYMGGLEALVPAS